MDRVSPRGGPMRTSGWLGVAFIAISGGLLACGDSAAPGTITVTTTGVAGFQGKLLITEARLTGRQAAIHCAPIAADPFSSTVVLETIVGPTPCEDSAPITLDPGTYDLLTAVIMGGSMTPDVCARAQVVVDGDVTVTMPALTAAACD